MDSETLRNELNLANAECHTLRQLNEGLWAERLTARSRPVHHIIAERVKYNVQFAAFVVAGVAGAYAGMAARQVARVKFPRLRVDWQ